jgi:hypothetical protein
MSRHLCTQSGPLAVGFSYEADLMSPNHCLICAWSSDVSEPNDIDVKYELAEMRNVTEKNDHFSRKTPDIAQTGCKAVYGFRNGR